MSAWLVIVVAGIGTFALRVGMVMAADRIRIPKWLDRASAFVAPAAMAALAATAIAGAATSNGPSAGITPIVAAAAAAFAVARTRKPQIAMLVGMPTLWLMTALFSP